MAMKDRPSNLMSSTPRETARGDGLTASTINRLVNSILRLITGDGKSISVSYVGGKAVISKIGNQIIPILKQVSSVVFYSFFSTDDFPDPAIAKGSICIYDGVPSMGSIADDNISSGPFGVYVMQDVANNSSARRQLLASNTHMDASGSAATGLVNLCMVIKVSSYIELFSLNVPAGTIAITGTNTAGNNGGITSGGLNGGAYTSRVATDSPQGVYIKVEDESYIGEAGGGGWHRIATMVGDFNRLPDVT